MGIYFRIRDLASSFNTSVKEIERILGLGNGTIRKWDETSPTCERALKVANFFDVPLEWLITGVPNDTQLDSTEKELIKNFRRLSFFNQQKVKEYTEMFETSHRSYDFWTTEINGIPHMRIYDGSMEPIIMQDRFIPYEKSDHYENGDIVIISKLIALPLTKEDKEFVSLYCREYNFDGEEYIFSPYNKNYADMIFYKDSTEFQILGKMIKN